MYIFIKHWLFYTEYNFKMDGPKCFFTHRVLIIILNGVKDLENIILPTVDIQTLLSSCYNKFKVVRRL